jgi:hypothetical protein
MAFPVEKTIFGNYWILTGSIVLNRLVMPRIISFFDIAKNAMIGDDYVKVLGAEHGGALYLSDVMSVYRSGVPGSYNERRRNDPNYLVSALRSHIDCNNKMNAFTKNKYSNLFDKANKRLYFSLMCNSHLDMNIKKSVIEADMNNIDIKDQMSWNLIFKHPYAIRILKNVHMVALRVLGRRKRCHLKIQDFPREKRGV